MITHELVVNFEHRPNQCTLTLLWSWESCPQLYNAVVTQIHASAQGSAQYNHRATRARAVSAFLSPGTTRKQLAGAGDHMWSASWKQQQRDTREVRHRPFGSLPPPAASFPALGGKGIPASFVAFCICYCFFLAWGEGGAVQHAV